MPIETIDEYVQTFPTEVQAILEEIRRTVGAVVPDADEVISYGMPTLRLGTRKIVHFGAYKHHIGFYPAPSGPADFERQIAPYRAGRSSIRFPTKDPIPHELVRRIVELLLGEARRANAE